MLTTVMARGKQDIYLSCGHRIRHAQLPVNHIVNCYQCDRNKKLHSKPLKETATYKANRIIHK